MSFPCSCKSRCHGAFLRTASVCEASGAPTAPLGPFLVWKKIEPAWVGSGNPSMVFMSPNVSMGRTGTCGGRHFYTWGKNSWLLFQGTMQNDYFGKARFQAWSYNYMGVKDQEGRLTKLLSTTCNYSSAWSHCFGSNCKAFALCWGTKAMVETRWP